MDFQAPTCFLASHFFCLADQYPPPPPLPRSIQRTAEALSLDPLKVAAYVKVPEPEYAFYLSLLAALDSSAVGSNSAAARESWGFYRRDKILRAAAQSKVCTLPRSTAPSLFLLLTVFFQRLFAAEEVSRQNIRVRRRTRFCAAVQDRQAAASAFP